uniref:Uncharacterized protein n=1 Tax=Anguilla anguilla TaxID=7936 RepID=A0A0E9VBU9_ANGAN
MKPLGPELCLRCRLETSAR